MTELECPNCGHFFLVEDYTSGYCPNCELTYYYWDDDWDYITEEELNPGFYWA